MANMQPHQNRQIKGVTLRMLQNDVSKFRSLYKKELAERFYVAPLHRYLYELAEGIMYESDYVTAPSTAAAVLRDLSKFDYTKAYKRIRRFMSGDDKGNIKGEKLILSLYLEREVHTIYHEIVKAAGKKAPITKSLLIFALKEILIAKRDKHKKKLTQISDLFESQGVKFEGLMATLNILDLDKCIETLDSFIT